MNKNDFIDILEKNLLRLPKTDRDDILSDYEAHFALGAEAGKSEEEVSASLGDPNELAQIYLENLPEGSKGAPAALNEDEPQTEDEPLPEEEKPAAPAYSAASYSDNASSSTYSTAAPVEKKSPDAGAVVGVVFLSIAALCLLGFIVDIWFGIAGGSIFCFAAAAAMIGLGISFAAESALVCIGAVLLAVALAALGVLLIIACIAGVHGIIYLVKKFIKLCKNILNGGNE